MNTITATSKEIILKSKTRDYAAFWKGLEFYRFVLNILIMAFLAILGAIASAFAIQHSMELMALVAFPAMLCFSMILALAPMKVLFGTAALSLTIDLVIIVLFLVA